MTYPNRGQIIKWKSHKKKLDSLEKTFYVNMKIVKMKQPRKKDFTEDFISYAPNIKRTQKWATGKESTMSKPLFITKEEIESLERLLYYLRSYKNGSDYQVLAEVIERAKSND